MHLLDEGPLGVLGCDRLHTQDLKRKRFFEKKMCNSSELLIEALARFQSSGYVEFIETLNSSKYKVIMDFLDWVVHVSILVFLKSL